MNNLFNKGNREGRGEKLNLKGRTLDIHAMTLKSEKKCDTCIILALIKMVEEKLHIGENKIKNILNYYF